MPTTDPTGETRLSPKQRKLHDYVQELATDRGMTAAAVLDDLIRGHAEDSSPEEGFRALAARWGLSVKRLADLQELLGAPAEPAPVLDANGDPLPDPQGWDLTEQGRAWWSGRVPAAECPHYIAASEARAGFRHCERCPSGSDADGSELREVDPAEVEAEIDAFMADSEPERRADRLAAGIVDSEVVAAEPDAPDQPREVWHSVAGGPQPPTTSAQFDINLDNMEPGDRSQVDPWVGPLAAQLRMLTQAVRRAETNHRWDVVTAAAGQAEATLAALDRAGTDSEPEPTDPRAAKIQAIRDLADWLAAHPDAPVWEVRAWDCVSDTDDDREGEQRIGDLATRLGLLPVANGDHDWHVQQTFGDHVEWKCWYTQQAAKRRYQAASTYHGSVQPEGGDPR